MIAGMTCHKQVKGRERRGWGGGGAAALGVETAEYQHPRIKGANREWVSGIDEKKGKKFHFGCGTSSMIEDEQAVQAVMTVANG